MKRRTFLNALVGCATVPSLTYSVIAPPAWSIAEGTPPAKPVITAAPTVIGAAEAEWPVWQYGDYICADHHLSEQEILDYKFLCRAQAKETFEALQVPDACDKLEYSVHQPLGPLSATVGWKVTIPAPQWQYVLSKHPDPAGYLKQVLKTRKRMLPVSLNGNTQLVPRGYVRDYLRIVANK